MAWRKSHGNAAKHGRLVVLESPPFDEQPPASPATTAPSDRDAAGRFTKGNRISRANKLRPGPRGLVGIELHAPDYRPFARWGARYGSHRRAELARAHGGEISAGVGAIIESAALSMAASRYVQFKAAATGDADLFRAASQLATTARQAERDAWELASREAVVRRTVSGRGPAAVERELERMRGATQSSADEPDHVETEGEPLDDDGAPESQPGGSDEP